MTSEIILTIFLVLLNGFFVAAEFAIVKVRVTQLSDTNSKASPKLLSASKQVVGNLDNYLAATQLGVTLASLGLGWVGEDVMTEIILRAIHLFHFNLSMEIIHKISVPIAFILITTLHIVFGELAPKSIAIRKAVNTTLVIAMPLKAFFFIFRPFIWLLNKMANGVLRLLGINPAQEQESHTEEEIKLIISESGESGVMEDSEIELIQNVFDFDVRRVREILVHRKEISAIDIKQPFTKIIDYVTQEGYSRYPVYEDDLNNVIGILYVKDMLQSLHLNKSEDVRKMLRPAFYIPDSMKIKDLLKTFQKDHNQMAIVTDEYGDIAGIVTMEDILEELVGDIQDEHDAELPIVEKQADGTFSVLAHQSIDDINEFLPLALPTDDHYSTLSGLITYHHGSVPVEGERLELEGYEMIILKMYRSSVERVLLKLLEPLEEKEKEEN
ncbi:hemolysin family protein [Rhizosphaericola mali]|uniref:HlyC/CorC family transporter n=1 Tax=Rhizosphaericola mali TaxID=2545455 RepID=A0A5P2FVF6_9BACT|nr:hemolysin family protein [Rhizosphaericola mali]QES87476.1 HlyC/CorC family transporter [Rhizosphaericola mali]